MKDLKHGAIRFSLTDTELQQIRKIAEEKNMKYYVEVFRYLLKQELEK